MLDSSFFLPLPVIKPVDFGGVIVRGCHKVFSVKAEVSIVHQVRMLDGGFFLPLPVIKPEILAVLSQAVTRCFPSGLKQALMTLSECWMVAFSCHCPSLSPPADFGGAIEKRLSQGVFRQG